MCPPLGRQFGRCCGSTGLLLAPCRASEGRVFLSKVPPRRFAVWLKEVFAARVFRCYHAAASRGSLFLNRRVDAIRASVGAHCLGLLGGEESFSTVVAPTTCCLYYLFFNYLYGAVFMRKDEPGCAVFMRDRDVWMCGVYAGITYSNHRFLWKFCGGGGLQKSFRSAFR